MATKRYKPEQIISKLREAEVLMAKGISVSQASKQIGIVEQTYYRWRKELGSLIFHTPSNKPVQGWSSVGVRDSIPLTCTHTTPFKPFEFSRVRGVISPRNLSYTLLHKPV